MEEMTTDDAIKYQRRFAKYERELVRCGGDIQALSRFTNAQVVAFRKILKKYKVRVSYSNRFCTRVLSRVLTPIAEMDWLDILDRPLQ